MKKITTSTLALYAAISSVAAAVADTGKIGIECKNGNVIVHACNGSAHASCIVMDAKAGEDTAPIPIPSKQAQALLKTSETDSPVELKITDETVVFEFCGSKIRVKRDDKQESLFSIQIEANEKLVDMGFLSGKGFAKALRLSEGYCENNSPQIFTKGVIIEQREADLLFFATNGAALSAASMSGVTNLQLSSQVLIPQHYAAFIGKEAKSADVIHVKGVVVDTKIRRLRFEFGDFRLTCPLIDTAIPSFGKIAAEPETLTNYTVATSEMSSAVRRLEVMSSTIVMIEFGEFAKVFDREDKEASQADVATEVTGVGATSLIAVNPKILLKALSDVRSEKLIVQVSTDSTKAVRICEQFDEDDAPEVAWSCVLARMRA